jgi:hypothetical protein
VIESDYRGKRTKLRFGLESSRKKREREREMCGRSGNGTKRKLQKRSANGD